MKKHLYFISVTGLVLLSIFFTGCNSEPKNEPADYIVHELNDDSSPFLIRTEWFDQDLLPDFYLFFIPTSITGEDGIEKYYNTGYVWIDCRQTNCYVEYFARYVFNDKKIMFYDIKGFNIAENGYEYVRMDKLNMLNQTDELPPFKQMDKLPMFNQEEQYSFNNGILTIGTYKFTSIYIY